MADSEESQVAAATPNTDSVPDETQRTDANEIGSAGLEEGNEQSAEHEDGEGVPEDVESSAAAKSSWFSSAMSGAVSGGWRALSAVTQKAKDVANNPSVKKVASASVQKVKGVAAASKSNVSKLTEAGKQRAGNIGKASAQLAQGAKERAGNLSKVSAQLAQGAKERYSQVRQNPKAVKEAVVGAVRTAAGHLKGGDVAEAEAQELERLAGALSNLQPVAAEEILAKWSQRWAANGDCGGQPWRDVFWCTAAPKAVAEYAAMHLDTTQQGVTLLKALMLEAEDGGVAVDGLQAVFEAAQPCVPTVQQIIASACADVLMRCRKDEACHNVLANVQNLLDTADKTWQRVDRLPQVSLDGTVTVGSANLMQGASADDVLRERVLSTAQLLDQLSQAVTNAQAGLPDVESHIGAQSGMDDVVLAATEQVSKANQMVSGARASLEDGEKEAAACSDKLDADLRGLKDKESGLDSECTELQNKVAKLAEELRLCQQQLGGKQADLSATRDAMEERRKEGQQQMTDCQKILSDRQAELSQLEAQLKAHQSVSRFTSQVCEAVKTAASDAKAGLNTSLSAASEQSLRAAQEHAKHQIATVHLICRQISYVGTSLQELDTQREELQRLGMHAELRGLPERRNRLLGMLQEAGQRLASVGEDVEALRGIPDLLPIDGKDGALKSQCGELLNLVAKLSSELSEAGKLQARETSSAQEIVEEAAQAPENIVFEGFSDEEEEDSTALDDSSIQAVMSTSTPRTKKSEDQNELAEAQTSEQNITEEKEDSNSDDGKQGTEGSGNAETSGMDGQTEGESSNVIDGEKMESQDTNEE